MADEDAVEQGGDGLTVLRVEALDGLELKVESASGPRASASKMSRSVVGRSA
jgi:hypothetical protein